MMKSLIITAVLFASTVSAAEAPVETMDALLAKRAGVVAMLAKTEEQWAANRAAFMDLPETKAFNDAQADLLKAYRESGKRLTTLDATIAERVAKERE